MYNPKDVFENPSKYWEFITSDSDEKFEGKYFDRKEACRPDENNVVPKENLKKLRQEICQCISAFSNSNPEGGLLVLGVSTIGEVKGINHLDEDQRNGLTDINKLLRSQTAIVNYFDCKDENGNDNRICLIYAPYQTNAICETVGNSPKAWLRQGNQNILMIDEMRERIKRDKKIVNFENSYCCNYSNNNIDDTVLNEFKSVYLTNAHYEYNNDELLYNIGAITKEGGKSSLTNAGQLFFASNPQRILSYAYIRLLRYEVDYEDYDNYGLPTFGRDFTGPITKQIRDARTYFKESGLFKIYQKRNPGGGFSEEPEYPYLAIDEAIVNAVTHRDYAIALPIQCIKFRNAFVVRSPGELLQSAKSVPETFSLNDYNLVHTPRNPKLLEWLKIMKDERGAAFVRALSEGTRIMRYEMNKAKLLAPIYKVRDGQTEVVLYNNYKEREAAYKRNIKQENNEFTNLYPFDFLTKDDIKTIEHNSLDFKFKDVYYLLKNSLIANDWYIDNDKFSRIIAHKRSSYFILPEVSNILRIYPAYVFQIKKVNDVYCLSIDYSVQVKNILNLKKLLCYLNSDDFIGVSCVVNWSGWQNGVITKVSSETASIYLPAYDNEIIAYHDAIIPNIPLKYIDKVLKNQNIEFDIHSRIKQLSLLTEPNASRVRAEKIQEIAEYLHHNIFPLTLNDMNIMLKTNPVVLSNSVNSPDVLHVDSISEPSVEFYRHNESNNIREGITKYGSYSFSRKDIKLIPVCLHGFKVDMKKLIERLSSGKFRYRGSERTFSTKFLYDSIVTVDSPEEGTEECRRLVEQHPNWVGNKNLDILFLIHVPEQGYSSDDENSPYYRIKRYLFENGIPCQMVDTPTLQDPDWKDLNLSLNIVAKCGVTPWVLPDALPDADFFIGLSYTQNYRKDNSRLMGYANVFNQYGRWEFYSGNTQTFLYVERASYFEELIKNTLSKLPLSDTPHIHFHYSARFSREDIQAILRAAKSVRPFGEYTFLWINEHHNIRLYDNRPETDGSLSRGKYVITSPSQLYLSTTGNNPFKKVLGTPIMLEINVYNFKPEGVPVSTSDYKSIAKQVLSLTKLNVASTDSICAEPITIKYARNIAYLTDAFLRQGSIFKLHPVLEKTPWFI